jgi:tetratricopeptide (TPR) repeat protein
MMKRTLRLVLLADLLIATGCGIRSRSPYADGRHEVRDPVTAARLTIEAADLIDTEPERARALLREALAADLFHGPAHNNLGVLYLVRGDLYEAAHEFEWARKLMPGHPDPRLNLALTLERAGRIDEALATYETALEVYTGHLPTIQALTRCRVRHDRADDRVTERLQEIALRGQTKRWRDWAQRQLSSALPP